MTNKPNTYKTIEPREAELLADVYWLDLTPDVETNEGSYHSGTQLMKAYVDGHDAAIQLCEQRERDLVEALKFSHMTINHALALGYVGEGSTNGMFKDALNRAELALKKHRGTK